MQSYTKDMKETLERVILPTAADTKSKTIMLGTAGIFNENNYWWQITNHLSIENPRSFSPAAEPARLAEPARAEPAPANGRDAPTARRACACSWVGNAAPQWACAGHRKKAAWRNCGSLSERPTVGAASRRPVPSTLPLAAAVR